MRSLGVLFVAGVWLTPPVLPAQTRSRAEMVRAIDSLALAPIQRGQIAGMSVAVVKGRDTILIKGYGSADLELEVPTPANAVYEIGSVTKQFTTAALLQLVEQSKVSLDDDITKYLPTYPSRGNAISIRRILDHTSGIRSYTEIAEARGAMKNPISKDSLTALFGGKGFDFAPGTNLVYNNSAFFLAGLIIEKVSGHSYADYVQANIFDRLGMSNSKYCSESALMKRKVHGYGFAGSGLVKAFQQDHSWPYAAGSLCSTAGDLITWLRALHTTDQVISRASYQEMITPGTLNDGYRVRYAKGIVAGEEDGRRMISHGGGISGFVSETRYYPDDDLYVVVLINTAGPVGAPDGAKGIAQIVLGPGKALKGQSFAGDLTQLAGKYRGVGRGFPMELTLAVDGGVLKARQGNQGTGRTLTYIGNDTFQGPGSDRYVMIRDGAKVTAVRVDMVSVVSMARRVE